MPINMMINILGSVGAGGKNQKDDVRAVQRQLNGLINPPRKYLTEDGVSGKKTIGTIRDFQRTVCKFRKPDGRVDPNGTTLRNLNAPNSEGVWAGMSMMPDDYRPAPTDNVKTPAANGGGMPQVPNGAMTERELTLLEEVYAHFQSVHDPKPATDFLDHLIKNNIPLLKSILATQGITQYAVELARGIVIAKRAGFSVRDIAMIYKSFALKFGRSVDDVTVMLTKFSKSPKIGQLLGKVGKAAAVAGIMIACCEAADHFRNGKIGPGMSSLYGGLMGLLVPWGAAVNAAQTLLYMYYPAGNNPKMDAAFKLIVALDPIGCGQAAVDSLWSMVQFWLVSAATGKLQMHEVEALVKRLKNSPMRFWTDIGEDFGDWLGENMGTQILWLAEKLEI